MKIYPAIDLMNSKCVRLEKGDFATQKVFADSPMEVARDYQKRGSNYLHVVDLDGAKQGSPVHTSLIIEINKHTDLKLQVGGGLRKMQDVEKLIDSGIDRVVLGSLAVKDKDLTSAMVEQIGGEHVTIAVDVQPKDGQFYIATHGWQQTSSTTPEELITFYAAKGVEAFLCTDISKDGMMKGPSFPLYEKLSQTFPSLEIQASGGIRNQNDLSDLKKLGAGGAIIGKALYQGTVTIEEALSC